MLDPWIIEEILKKEDELRRERENVHVELPLPVDNRNRYRDTGENPAVTPARDESERGVMIIDI